MRRRAACPAVGGVGADWWTALDLPRAGVVACVGAGGKTSLLLALLARAVAGGLPVVLTATTKMYYRQVAHMDPVLTEDFAQGALQVERLLALRGHAAWFLRQEEDKVIGLPPALVDRLAAVWPQAVILAEADGARGRLLKAPAKWEPVLPERTAVTIGVLNLAALGLPLAAQRVHRLERVCALLQKEPGAGITLEDFALLASSPQGIFQHSRGQRLLVFAGGERAGGVCGRELAAALRRQRTPAVRCVLAVRAAGGDARPEAAEVHEL